MKAWTAGLMALAMALVVGCTPQQPVDGPAEEPIVSVYEEPTPTPVVVEETPAPETEDKYTFPYADKMQEAVDINSDVVGWICIPGTNIDFPILFGQDWYYSGRDINKEKNNIGSIYSHLNIESYIRYNTQQNLVVAGSNARLSKTLFHDLHHIQEVNQGNMNCPYSRCDAQLDPAVLPDFTTAQGRTWDISICGIEGKWEVWSVYETSSEEPEKTLYYNTWFPQPESEGSDVYLNVPGSPDEVQKWIDTQLERSQFDLGVEVSPTDQFLTIYTSGDEHDALGFARLYYFLKLAEPTGEPYWQDAADTSHEGEPAQEQVSN